MTGDFSFCKIIGEGTIDLKKVVSELNDNGYDGWYTVEFEGVEEPEEGSIRAVSNTYELMKAMEKH